MKPLAVLSLVLLLLLATVLPAAADPPQTWYEFDDAYDFLAVDCVVYGYDFEVWDHEVYHISETGYFDHAGNLLRTLVQTQGTDNLYKSSAPGVFLASGPFKYLQHVEILNYVPGDPTQTLAEVRFTGTAWNVHLPGGAVIRRAGQQLEIVQGEPPDTVLLATTKWVGLTSFDDRAICAALADQVRLQGSCRLNLAWAKRCGLCPEGCSLLRSVEHSHV